METEEDLVGQYYDPSKNQMPYGGATDIHGKIVWVINKEKHDEIFDHSLASDLRKLYTQFWNDQWCFNRQQADRRLD